MRAISTTTALLLLLPLAAYALIQNRHRRRRRVRTAKLRPRGEHVLILGAGSGVGRALAVRYAERGAWVCLVSRGGAALQEAREEVVSAARRMGLVHRDGSPEDRVLSVEADFSSAEDMVRVRDFLGKGEHVMRLVLVCY